MSEPDSSSESESSSSSPIYSLFHVQFCFSARFKKFHQVILTCALCRAVYIDRIQRMQNNSLIEFNWCHKLCKTYWLQKNWLVLHPCKSPGSPPTMTPDDWSGCCCCWSPCSIMVSRGPPTPDDEVATLIRMPFWAHSTVIWMCQDSMIISRHLCLPTAGS